jgi:phenylpropionate dioxygenase-like ring-hydroxylating dioxygenase large terminal subunit
MFTNQHHLGHLLRPDQYVSQEQHRTELRHLFQSAWHPLCTTSDLAKPGAFLTFDLMETPILLRNFEGELRAFLNVCPHRHSRLTDKTAGTTPTLRCQYHGWEFNKDGGTGKIPEARAFRPWDRENACLKRFRLETCGEVVFVNLSDVGPSLRAWCGPLWERWEPVFGGPYRPALTWEADFACNWKVVLENSLESYHIPLVHPKTFGPMPTEENAWHELEPTFTTFKTMISNDWINRCQAWMVRRMGQRPTWEYWHYNRHPHLTVSTLDVHRLIMCVYPLTPTTCRYRSMLFTLRGTNPGPLAWALGRFLRPIVIQVAKKVFGEDGGLYPAIQRGLEASPHRGVIGTREERIYYFQKFVLDGCSNGPRELPQVDAGVNGEAVTPDRVVSVAGVSDPGAIRAE